jgi:hypothetical protein
MLKVRILDEALEFESNLLLGEVDIRNTRLKVGALP